MKTIALVALLALAGPTWAQSSSPGVQNIINNLGAINQGMIYPPGSLYYPVIDPQFDLNPDNDPPTNVIEIQGEGVQPIPAIVGPIRSRTIHGRIAPILDE